MASIQNQIDSNAVYARKLQEEEMNFGFKPQFDTQGNSNLAKRIGDAERAGASEEDIQIILSEHDYVRSSVLTPQNQPTPSVPSGTPPSVASPAVASSPSRPSRPLKRTSPKKCDKPARPDNTPTKVVKKVEQNIASFFDKFMEHLPTIVFIVVLAIFIYKVFFSPVKGSKGKKGKGKGKGKKK